LLESALNSKSRIQNEGWHSERANSKSLREQVIFLDNKLREVLKENNQLKEEIEFWKSSCNSLEQEKQFYNQTQEVEYYKNQVRRYRQEFDRLTQNFTEDIENYEHTIGKLKLKVKTLKSQKAENSSKYIKKIKELEEKLDQISEDKENHIQYLTDKCRKLKNATSRTRRSKSPLSKTPNTRSRTPLTSSRSIQDSEGISKMISELEKSQADYKHKYKNLLNKSSVSKEEFLRVSQILQNNEKKLKEARKLQASLARKV